MKQDAQMPPELSGHRIRFSAKAATSVALAVAVAGRVVGTIAALRGGDEAPLLAFPLAVIFPALLLAALAGLPPTASREGALMRLGTMVQCVAMVALPRLALHLALGLPVVFLAVELFETRCPRGLHDAVVRRLVA